MTESGAGASADVAVRTHNELQAWEAHEMGNASALLAAIVESSDDAIIGKSLDGTILSWNRGAQRMYGYTADEVLGRSIEMLVPPEHPNEIPGILVRIRRGERLDHFETVRLTKDGRRIDISLTISPIEDASGTITGASTIARDITERKRIEVEHVRLLERERVARTQAEEAERRLAFLSEASKVLASSLDYEATLRSVARLAVPHIGDWCTVHVVEEDGSVQQLAVAHVDPSKVDLAWELDRRYPFDADALGGVAEVLRTGRSEIIPEIRDDLLVAGASDTELLSILRELGLRSSMIVPLLARGHILGTIAFVSAESGRRYGASDLTLAEELASRAALAVDNARLYGLSVRTAAEQWATLDQMTDGVIMVDRVGRVTYMNRAARRLIGVDGHAGSLDSLGALLRPRRADGQPAEATDAPLVQALAGQTVMNVERRVRRPDGTEIITQTSAAPVEVEDGGRLGAVAVFRDVTAERELEREKDAFLSAAAHDLKTPLTTIKGLAEIVRRRILRGDAGETSRVLENLERIEVAATRMSRLVNDLLDASRTQMGRRLDLSRSRVDLAAMVRRLTSEIQHSTRGHHLVMESSVPALLGVWDADRLERVFMNLLTNAVKYSPEGGTIAVRVTPEYGSAGAWAVVSVHDQGLGIPARDLPYIFERFYRAGNVEGQIQGTGIGLASARQIVEQHGGTIEVASKEGESTTVTVRLPLQPEVSDGAECGWKLDSDLR